MTNKILSLFAGSTNLQFATQRLPEIFSVLLITGSAYTAANITWAITNQNNELTQAAPITNIKTAKPSNSAQVFRDLSNAHIFGQVNKI